MKLQASHVEEILKDCLFTDAEMSDPDMPPAGAVLVDGLIHNFAFHPDRLESHAREIGDLLACLPTEFQPASVGGGGWTFLNACVDVEGRQWGEHRDIERLICLGIGTKQAEWQMKNMASVLPGGVPYFGVKVRR